MRECGKESWLDHLRVCFTLTKPCAVPFIPGSWGPTKRSFIRDLDEVMSLGFRTVLDIGAAEGYYACGLARALPQAKVVAFEADLKGRYLLDRNIGLNGLEDRVTVRGFCNPALLASELDNAQAPVLVICDTEGYEYDLLSPAAVLGLRHCSILVELHDPLLPGLTSIIKERFAATHSLREYNAQPRTRQDFPLWNHDGYVTRLPFRYLDTYLNEHRPAGMNWLWMKPKEMARGG